MGRLYRWALLVVVVLMLTTALGQVFVGIGLLIGAVMVAGLTAVLTGFALGLVTAIVGVLACVVVGWLTRSDEVVPEDAGAVLAMASMGVVAAQMNMALGYMAPWPVWLGSIGGSVVASVFILFMVSSILTESGVERRAAPIFAILTSVAVIAYFTSATWVG